MYLPRVLGLGVGALCVGGGLLQAAAPLWTWLLLALNCLAWPHLAYRVARRARDPYAAELRNLMLDSAAGGAWVAAIGFNLVPSAVLIGMLAMDKAAVGGMRFLGRCLVAQIAAAAGVASLTGFAFNLESDLIAEVAALPLLLLYPVTVGYTAYRLARRVRQQNELLATLSTIDGLTRLMNRTNWEQAAANEFQRCRRMGHSAAVMMLDIDHFKAVNDTHGHQTGDVALQSVASILRVTPKLPHLAGSYGGEEVGVVPPGIDPPRAPALAGRIRQRIGPPVGEQ